MILKTIIIDDEVKAIETLEMLLTNYCDGIEIIGTASSSDEALKLIKNSEPNLVFLDIEMPNKTGFELISNLGVFHFSLVFVTAYNQYAIKAFDLSAIDYLLKPVPIERLKKTINRIKTRNAFKSDFNSYKVLSNQFKSGKLTSITIPYKDRHVVVKFENLIGIEANQAYTSLVCINDSGELKSYTYSKNLSYFENLLTKNLGFFRCHRSWIINLKHVRALNKKGFEAQTINGLTIPISRRKIKAFSELI